MHNIIKFIIALYLTIICYYLIIENDHDLISIFNYFIISMAILLLSRFFIILRNFFDA